MVSLRGSSRRSSDENDVFALPFDTLHCHAEQKAMTPTTSSVITDRYIDVQLHERHASSKKKRIKPDDK